jgi:spermidine/putrescine transport system permease protein
MAGATRPRIGSDARRPWLLLAPTLIVLILLLVLPILVMLRFTFYEFVTAGVERTVITIANWREFFSDPYYHGFLWKTARVSAITALLCAAMGYPPAYFIAMTSYRHKWLLLLLLIVPFWISFTIRTFSWIHILGEQGAINARARR